MHDKVVKLSDKDFTAKFRYELEAVKMKKKDYTYEFYDFSPKVFHIMRKQFGIESD